MSLSNGNEEKGLRDCVWYEAEISPELLEKKGQWQRIPDTLEGKSFWVQRGLCVEKGIYSTQDVGVEEQNHAAEILDIHHFPSVGEALMSYPKSLLYSQFTCGHSMMKWKQPHSQTFSRAKSVFQENASTHKRWGGGGG